MKIRFLAGLIGLMVSIACNPSARETPVGLRPKLVMPAETSEPPSAPIAGRRRTEKLQLPPPMLPPPKADGQPQSPLDLKAITQAALDGKPITRAGIPNIERVDADHFRIGTVSLDRKTRRIEVPSRLNMDKGILEYYAVASRGMLHEAVLEVHAEPSHIHLAMLLAAYQPGEYAPDPRLGRRLKKAGSLARLFVEFTDPKSGKLQRKPAEAWLFSRRSKGAPAARAWMFTGGTFWNGTYGGDLSRSVVGLVTDDSCILAVPVDEGNPYQGSMMGYEMFTKVLPPLNTPVVLVIEPSP